MNTPEHISHDVLSANAVANIVANAAAMAAGRAVPTGLLRLMKQRRCSSRKRRQFRSGAAEGAKP